MSASTASHDSSVDTTTLTQINGKRKRVLTPEDTKVHVGDSTIKEKQLDRFHGLLEDILVVLRRSAFPPVRWLDYLLHPYT